ncbi:hypothetical protein A2713_00650 [candidate division WWE3 bacterium RIFCSPHIGHO2_01_FULL_35_17]|uniref:Uncharacterized protein n=1 Tax=candidate division WWE3 bacterium RIFCSPHIGHO2_01_FULL_35_17 TaxID=1802614 RepID=A0A1F4USR4_UNCKA|nr:MAG: hypothetical protein A2713_00650 [candidate division WWE3 bacterium RIFCSPHIGHO2_01_FULL_35_17]
MKNKIKHIIFITVLAAVFLIALFSSSRIEHFKENGNIDDLIAPIFAILVFAAYFGWLYFKAIKNYPVFKKFFWLSVFIAFIGEMSMGLDTKIETAVSGSYWEFLAMPLAYLTLGMIAFYLSLLIKSKRIYYLAMFIVGVPLLEVLLLKNITILTFPPFTILSASFYWTLSVYPRYFANPEISWELKRKRLKRIVISALVSLFIIAPIMIFGLGIRQPDFIERGINFIPLDMWVLGIGVTFYAIIFFMDFLPDIIKKDYWLKEK